MLEKGPLWEGARPGSPMSSVCKVMLVQHGTLVSKVHHPQDCPKVCKTHGILLEVRSLSYSSESPESAADIPWELQFVLVPSCSDGEGFASARICVAPLAHHSSVFSWQCVVELQPSPQCCPAFHSG